MDEIKFINCEQYVLARLFKLEQENEKLKAELADAETAIRQKDDKFNTLLNNIKRGTKVKLGCNGTGRYIDIPSVWEQYDDNFELLVELLELELPEPINNTKEEN